MIGDNAIIIDVTSCCIYRIILLIWNDIIGLNWNGLDGRPMVYVICGLLTWNPG